MDDLPMTEFLEAMTDAIRIPSRKADEAEAPCQKTSDTQRRGPVKQYNAALAKRRKAVAKLSTTGMTHRQMAAEMGVSVDVIKRDMAVVREGRG